jgi:uncharacterized protein YndB with AHSA1/START domain
MGAWGAQACEVLTAEPERLFAYAFGQGTLNTIITWRLQAEAQGTRLLFEQKGFDLESPMGQTAYQGMGAGWPLILGRIDPAFQSTPPAGRILDRQTGFRDNSRQSIYATR